MEVSGNISASLMISSTGLVVPSTSLVVPSNVLVSFGDLSATFMPVSGFPAIFGLVSAYFGPFLLGFHLCWLVWYCLGLFCPI